MRPVLLWGVLPAFDAKTSPPAAHLLGELLPIVAEISAVLDPEQLMPAIAGPGGRPVLPASILTEAMAQAGAVLILAKPENRARLIYFMSIDRVRYRRPVSAGDTVLLEGTVVRLRARMGSLRGVARVDGRVVCEGQMTFALGDPPSA